MAHALNPSALEAEAGGFWSTNRIRDLVPEKQRKRRKGGREDRSKISKSNS